VEVLNRVLARIDLERRLKLAGIKIGIDNGSQKEKNNDSRNVEGEGSKERSQRNNVAESI
jgi:hypothetical protein